MVVWCHTNHRVADNILDLVCNIFLVVVERFDKSLEDSKVDMMGNNKYLGEAGEVDKDNSLDMEDSAFDALVWNINPGRLEEVRIGMPKAFVKYHHLKFNFN